MPFEFNLNNASVLKQPVYATILTHIPGVTVKGVTHFGYCTVAVLGQCLHQNCGATRAVALVSNLFETCPFASTQRAFDRALNVIHRHVCVAGTLHSDTQAEIRIGITATAFAHRDHNFTTQPGKKLPSTGVVYSLRALNLRPFRVT